MKAYRYLGLQKVTAPNLRWSDSIKAWGTPTDYDIFRGAVVIPFQKERPKEHPSEIIDVHDADTLKSLLNSLSFTPVSEGTDEKKRPVLPDDRELLAYEYDEARGQLDALKVDIKNTAEAMGVPYEGASPSEQLEGIRHTWAQLEDRNEALTAKLDTTEESLDKLRVQLADSELNSMDYTQRIAYRDTKYATVKKERDALRELVKTLWGEK